MDKLGIFHANQISMSIFVFLSCFLICSLQPCGHLLGKG